MRPVAKRILAVLLAAAMLCPLSSCKKKNKPQRTVIKESDPYFDAHVVELDIPVALDPEKTVMYKSISSEELVGDKVVAAYSLSYEIPDSFWDTDYENATEEENEKIGQFLDEYYVQGVGIFNFDGEMISTIDVDENLQICCLGEGKDGTILAVMASFMYTGDPEAMTSDYILCRFDMEGNQISKTVISGEMGFYPDCVCELDNGVIGLSAYGELYVVTEDGKVTGVLEDQQIQGPLFPCGEELYAVIINVDSENSEYGAQLAKIDLEKVEFTDKAMHMDGYYTMCPDGQGGCIVVTGDGLEHADIHTGEINEYLNWDNTDVNFSNIGSIRVYSDDHIVFLREMWEADEETGDIGTSVYVTELKRAQTNPHMGKTYIDLGMVGTPGSALMDYIVSYNADPVNIARIRIRDYSEIGGERTLKNVNAASDKMYLDLLAGTGPDILVGFSGYSQFNSEDVLVDLNTFIDGENGFNREEYFDNVLSAFETRDKLYHIPVCFDIRGLLGNMKMVGSRSGWTYPEFSHIVDNLDPEVTVLPPMTYEMLLESLLSCSMNNYIDYEKKEVYFDGDEFRQLLQIVKQYGVDHVDEPSYVSEEEFMQYNYYLYQNYSDVLMMEEGMLALMDTYIYRLDQYAANSSILNGRVVYIGMPSPDGTGMTAAPMLTMAISAFSDNQEEAWDFIRQMFDVDAQYKYTTSYTSIPLSRKAFDKVNEVAIRQNDQDYKRYEEDALRYGVDVAELPIRITSEHVAGYLDLVENVSTIMSVDPAVFDIIDEEASAYFADEKTLDEVCRNIQNRTTTIVNERK